MFSSLRLTLLAVLSWTMFCSVAHADAIYQVQFDGGHGNQTGSSTVSLSYGSSVPVPNTLTNIFAQGIAGPNDLGVYGNVSAAGDPANPNSWMYSETTEEASLSDSLVLNNAPASGILALNVDVNGSILLMNEGTTMLQDGSCNECTNFTQAFVLLLGNAGQSGDCIELTGGQNAAPSAGCGLLTEGMNLLQLPYSQSSGDVPLSLTFDATALCEAQYWYFTGVEGSCASATEFLDTAQIASIVVEDANGNPVPGATATSLSGVSYTLPSPVPEPSSVLLLGSGIMGLLGVFRRKSRC